MLVVFESRNERFRQKGLKSLRKEYVQIFDNVEQFCSSVAEECFKNGVFISAEKLRISKRCKNAVFNFLKT